MTLCVAMDVYGEVDEDMVCLPASEVREGVPMCAACAADYDDGVCPVCAAQLCEYHGHMIGCAVSTLS